MYCVTKKYKVVYLIREQISRHTQYNEHSFQTEFVLKYFSNKKIE